jgi:hypothetical protein
MSSRFRLKIGPVEVEYEGDEPPTKEELLELAAAAAHVYNDRALGRRRRTSRGMSIQGDGLRVLGSTASIAERLNCVSGPELVVAAAARLTFVDGEEWFEPAQLLEEMKKATAHYDQEYRDTLLQDLGGLVKSGKLVEVAENLFALSPTMRRELQQALAE